MTLPSTVNASGYGWSSFKNALHGPVYYNGNGYCVLVNTTTKLGQAYIKASGGDTWATIGNTFAIHGNTILDSVAITISGSTLIAAYFPASGWVRYATLDLTSGSPTWSASAAMSTAGGVAGGHPSGATGWFIARRSDGTTVLVSSATITSMGADYYRTRVFVWASGGASGTNYELHNGSTTLDTSTQTNYVLRSVVQAGDRLHIVYTEHTSGAFAGLKHRTLESDNSFGTIGTIDSTPIGAAADTTAYTCGLGCTWDDSGTTRIVVPYVDSNGALTVARAATGSNPSFTTQAVSGTSTNDPEYTTANPGAAAADGTTVHLLWPDDTTLDIYHSKSAAGGAWDTPDEWTDAVAVAGLSAITATGLVGVLYDDGGTVKYDEYALGPVTYTGSGTPSLAALSAAGTGTHTAPTYTGTGTPSIAAITASAAGGTAVEYDGSGAPAIAAATASGTGAHTAPTYSGSGTPSVAAVTAAGTGTHTAPTYSGSGAASLAALTATGAGSHTAPVYSGDSAATLAAVTAASSGTHTAPTYSGAGAPTLAAATASASGTHVGPTYDGSASGTLAALTASGTGLFSTVEYVGTSAATLAAVTGVGSGTYDAGTFTGSGAATIAVVSATGTGSHTAPTYAGTGVTAVAAVQAAATGVQTPPTYTGAGAVIVGTLTAAGAGAFAPTFTGTGSASVAAVTVTGVGAFSEEIYTPRPEGTITIVLGPAATLAAVQGPDNMVTAHSPPEAVIVAGVAPGASISAQTPGASIGSATGPGATLVASIPPGATMAEAIS